MPVPARLALVQLSLAAIVLAGCSTGGSPKSSPARAAANLPTSTSHRPEPADAEPLPSVRMVCGTKVRRSVSAALGIQETRVSAPTWSNRIYRCVYEYPNGPITLSVKEGANAPEISTYFSGLESKLGSAEMLKGLAQGGFVAPNGDVVVRKDDQVLLVDVHALPATFVSTMTRADVAIAIAVAITGDWTGA